MDQQNKLKQSRRFEIQQKVFTPKMVKNNSSENYLNVTIEQQGIQKNGSIKGYSQKNIDQKIEKSNSKETMKKSTKLVDIENGITFQVQRNDQERVSRSPNICCCCICWIWICLILILILFLIFAYLVYCAFNNYHPDSDFTFWA